MLRILAIALLCFPHLLSAQHGDLNIVVENADEDELIGISVQLMQNEKQISAGVADLDGLLLLPKIQPGEYQLLFKHPLFGAYADTVVIEANAITIWRENIEVTGLELNTTLPYDAPIERRSMRMGQEIKPAQLNKIAIPKLNRADSTKKGPSDKAAVSMAADDTSTGNPNAVESALNGSLAVHIENCEKDNLFGATIQVMQDSTQIADGVIDIKGFLYLPNIPAGRYQVVLRHVALNKPLQYEVTIKPTKKSELRTTVKINEPRGCMFPRRAPLFDSNTGRTTYTADQILRNASMIRE